MKKSLIILTLLSLSLFPIPRAHAVVGVLLSGLGGDLISFAGSIVMVDGVARTEGTDVGGGIFEILGGLVVLDQQGNPTSELRALQPGDVTRLGLTSDQAAAYNAELPLLNAIDEQVTYEAIQKSAQGATPSEVQALALSSWNTNKILLTPAAVAVAEKLSQQQPR